MSEWKLAAPAPNQTPSPDKLAANRANAQQSTGPRTAEGKARSSQNARTHGLTARELVIRPEERDEFDGFLAAYRDDLRPAGPLEETLFAQLVSASWNLRRVRLLEAELFDGAADPFVDEQNEARLDRLSRYAQRFERTLYRATAELRRIQTERAARNLIRRSEAEALPPLASVQCLQATKRTQACAKTEHFRAELAGVDLEVARHVGHVPSGGVIPSLLRSQSEPTLTSAGARVSL